MSLNFEKYAAKGNEFVHLVSEELEVPGEKAGRIIRSVLHALRNRLTHEESFHLMAQLPMVLKSVYVDGWKFHKKFHRISHISEFLDEVRAEDGGMSDYDFGNDERAKAAVAAVFKTLNFFVSEGEMEDMLSMLPQEIRKFIRNSIEGDKKIL